MIEETNLEEQLWNELLLTYRKVLALKPNDRSVNDRRFAILVTKYEDLLSWYFTMVIAKFSGEPIDVET